MIPEILGIHHTALETLDLDASIDFYTELLGFSTKAVWGQRPARIAMLELKVGHRLELFERQSVIENGTGPVIHFALQTSDCRAAIEHVRAAGAKILGEPKRHEVVAHPRAFSAYVGFFAGPNGETIEFIEAEWL